MEPYIKALITDSYEQNKNFFRCRFMKNRRGDECNFVGTFSDTLTHFSIHTKVYLFECEGCTKQVVDFMDLVEHRSPSTGAICRGTVENMRQLRLERMKTIDAHRCRNVFIVGATRSEFEDYLRYKNTHGKQQSFGTPLYNDNEEEQTRHQPQQQRSSTPLAPTTPTPPPPTQAPTNHRELLLDFPLPVDFSRPPPVIPPEYFFNAPSVSQQHHQRSQYQHYAPQPQGNRTPGYVARPITPHGNPKPQNYQIGGGWNPYANPPSAKDAPATVRDNRSPSRPRGDFRRDRSQSRGAETHCQQSYQPPADPLQDRSRNGRSPPMGTHSHYGQNAKPAQNGNTSHYELRSRSRGRATVPMNANFRAGHQTGSSSRLESRSRATASVGARAPSRAPAPSSTSRETRSTRRSPSKGPSAPAYTLPFGGSTPNHEPMDLELEDPVPPPRPDRPRASTSLNTSVSQIKRNEVQTGVYNIRPQRVQDTVQKARTAVGYAGTRNRSPLREADAEEIAATEALKNRFAVKSRGTAKAKANSNRGAALLESIEPTNRKIETAEEREKKQNDLYLEKMRKIREKQRLEQEKIDDVVVDSGNLPTIAPNAAGTPPPQSVAAMLEPKEESEEDEPSTSASVPFQRRMNSPQTHATSYARRSDGKRHPSKSRSSRDDRANRRDRDRDSDGRCGDDRRRDHRSHPYERH